MVEARRVTVYESTEPPNGSFLHDSMQRDAVAACLCTAPLWVGTDWSPVSLMTRARHVHALSSPLTMLNSLESMAQVLLITDVDTTVDVIGYPIEEGVRPMVSRLRLLCLGLGILSTVMGCAGTPPPVAPLRATLAPAAPSAVAPPASPALADAPSVVAPLPYVPPPYATGTRGSDTYQPSPYEGSIDYERKMDEEERDYRQWRSAQEQEQERRYEWMR
jgi:hypothetical protein